MREMSKEFRQRLNDAAKVVGAQITDTTHSMVELWFDDRRTPPKAMLYFAELFALADAVTEHRRRWDQIHARERMIQAQQGEDLLT